MNVLRSEHISKRLRLAMLVIVCSVTLIGLPLIYNSYLNYRKSSEALLEIQSLKMLAELSNKISKERAPANNAMSSPQSELKQHIQALHVYRSEVDLQIEETSSILQRTGYMAVAQELQQGFKPALAQGRQSVDRYIAEPSQRRRMLQMQGAINDMFLAWDQSHEALQMLISQSKGKDTVLSNNYTLILLLSDLRDQAGRSASNIIAPLTFNQPIPGENFARSLQTQRQTQYLWALVNIVQPEEDKTPKFIALHQQVKRQFLDQGLPVVEKLLHESLSGQPYSMNSLQLTQAMVKKFTTVVDLQHYILDYSLNKAYQEQQSAQKNLAAAILIVVISLLTVLLTMTYANKWVFGPLIAAREQLFALAHFGEASLEHKQQRQNSGIFDAITRLQKKLQQREALEFQLKHLAHSDSLTGIANRFALEEYIKLLEKQPAQFKHSCLILIDIDNFKQVNDSFGHIMGDLVIQAVAQCLKDATRPSDLLVRYGGDEFLVLIQNINLQTALQIAEEIRRSVLLSAALDGTVFAQQQISISAGVAVGAGSWIALLAKADEALFRAKAKGKNSVSD